MITSTARTSERFSRLDIALTVVLVALGSLLMYANVEDPEPGMRAVSVAAIPLFLLVTVPLLWRSHAPLAALGAVLAGLLVHWLAVGEAVRCGVAFPGIALLTFAVAARLDGRETYLGLGLGMVAAVVVGVSDSLGIGVASVGIPLVLIAWGLGRVAHARGRMAVELETRNQELRRARDERAHMEVATDRAQLSADLDRLLDRRLGELATMADRGAEAVAGGTATALLTDIEVESRATLNEMRTLVGVLRSDDGVAAVAPQPTLTSLEALIVRMKGGDARLTAEGDPRALPASVELSAYRVVEHLLAALDDAPGTQVHVRFMSDTLELAVTGPARRRSRNAGAAVARARERIELHHGSLRASTHDGRSETIAALPLLGTA